VKDKVGIGVIGTGFARRVQIPAFLACENAHFVSVASRNLDNALATANEFGIGHLTGDWRETVAHPEVDLVCIATPPNLHHEMALFAIEHAKHVLCEKPFAMNVAEAEQMAAAARGRPLLALVDHELRFQPGRQVAHEMLRDGVIGKVRHAKADFQAPHRGDPDLPWNWWSDASAGGGALGAIVSHIIDSFHWFLGTDVSNVFCQLQTHIKERRDSSGEMRVVTSDDEANMLLRFHDDELTNDATGIVSVSMTEGPAYKNQLEFFGSDGVMRIEAGGETFIAKTAEPVWTRIDVEMAPPIPRIPDTGFAAGFMAFAPKIVEAIRYGKKFVEHAATFEDGLRVQRVLDAARESNADRCVINIR
jgi:predicted dehydrogenase